MGTVEVALERGPQGFERIVALKRLLPESARNPRHKEMFLREARLAALLAHPNVVHAFAFGELCDELFLAMEYVEGEPLSGVLAATRLEPALVAHVLAEVCAACTPRTSSATRAARHSTWSTGTSARTT
jgi:serine/threonine-protein kinase